MRKMLLSLVAVMVFLGMSAELFAADVAGVAIIRRRITQEGFVHDFAARELQASPQIKNKLNALRQEISARKLRFQVGYTSALDFSIEQITGAKLPANFQQHVSAQNAKAAAAMKTLAAPTPIPACSPTAPSFDWRKANGVTSIKDQGPCGSCWAFATIGAFEGSWRVFNGQIINAAEQDVLDCNTHGYSCNGGWWAFDLLTAQGVATEAAYPYTHVKAACRATAHPYRAVFWGYVPPAANDTPTVATLKQYLCAYGPLSVAVRVTGGFQAYTGGVFDEAQPATPGPVNHGVTLIGWDDSKQAWLIKNSWGTGWGSNCDYGTERGYMWIAYGHNTIGYAAAYVRAQQLLVNLAGRWKGNDNGTYYMNQHGTALWWLGMSADNGATWTNVFKGNIAGMAISGDWSDVPHGRINNHGTLQILIENANQLRRTGPSGTPFGGSHWSRLK